MVLEMDNGGAVDITPNWRVGGRACHLDVHNNFLHELKDQGLFIIRHIPVDKNDTDNFMKNVTSVVFNHHIPLYVGPYEYTSTGLSLNGEAVRE